MAKENSRLKSKSKRILAHAVAFSIPKKDLRRKVRNYIELGVFKDLKSKKTTKNEASKRILTMKDVSDWMLKCYHVLDIKVDKSRPKTLNIFIPGLLPKMTAGPQFILEFAAAVRKMGYKVRFIVYIHQDVSEEISRENLASYPSPISDLAKDVEILVMHDDTTIAINPDDMTVATLYNSAYYAQQIQSKCKDKKFIYMIQDDERYFYPANSNYNCVEQTYFMDYYPMFSIDILRDWFLMNNIGNLAKKDTKIISPVLFANAYLPSNEKFINNRDKKKKLLVYLRPHADRNCYDLTLYVLLKAVKDGIIDTKKWDIIGCGGTHNDTLNLEGGAVLKHMEQMPLKEYKESIYKYDVGFVLMGTPHTSTPVVDFPLSGLLTVTNSRGNRTQEAYNNISKNIIAKNGTPEDLVEGIREAIMRAEDLETRYKNAAESTFPKSFDDVWSSSHKSWLKSIMGEAV